ncbi:syntaxin-61-like [Hibiscus syriacus]|uniref:syntaxin-61-like n=1 Tax=Hibiscus syriacus TaxID=106335 RepID=UPI001924D2B1|nr:syntaxin-61-like [Hibiscus syriacus]
MDQKLRSQVIEVVGRINGRFGTLTDVPIHHLLKIHFTSSKKRFKTLLINCKQVFTNEKGFLLEVVSKFISPKICLLVVRASIGRNVDELDKAISVAARDPSWYGIDEVELESRRKWTANARIQVADVKKAVGAEKENDSSASAIRRELMRLPNSQQPDMPDHYSAKNTDDFIASESDRQTLLIKQQEEELEELNASVQRIGGVGLTIHEELLAQEKILDELGTEMDGTKNQLDFAQVIFFHNLQLEILNI